MGCCRKIITRSATRSVLCLKWVTPIRLITLLSLAIHIGVLFHSNTREDNIIATIVVLIHLTVAFLLLKECYLSVQYHGLLRAEKYQ